MERLTFLKDIEGKAQNRVEVWNRFVALENLGAKVNVNGAWKAIKRNTKMSAKNSLGYYELKKHNPQFE
jgi:hypothetical protein